MQEEQLKTEASNFLANLSKNNTPEENLNLSKNFGDKISGSSLLLNDELFKNFIRLISFDNIKEKLDSNQATTITEQIALCINGNEKCTNNKRDILIRTITGFDLLYEKKNPSKTTVKP